MRRRRVGRHTWLIALLLIAAAPGHSLALTDEDLFRDFTFNFVVPGGRALGLGGAYIAAADDATAAGANPAALHYINRIELFGEFRAISMDDAKFAASEGSASLVDPMLPYLELEATTVQKDSNIPSFASFAFPFQIRGTRATLALSREVVLDNESGLANTGLDFAAVELPWVNPTGGPAGGPIVEQYAISNQSEGNLDAELVNYNVGFSFSVGSDFSLGATATMASLDMLSGQISTVEDPLGLITTINPRVDEDADGALDPVTRVSTIDDDDSSFTWTAGLHYHPDSKYESGFSPVRFGAVYRKGAKLGVDQTVITDTGGGTPSIRSFENTLRVPDRFGLGVSGEIGDAWIFAVDLERIEYSDLLENFKIGENFFTSGLIGEGVLDIDPAESVIFDVDDATVVHLGIEYNLITSGAWTYGFRGGYYNAPDNRIRMTQFNSNDAAVNDVFLTAFGGGQDEDHFTGGFSFNSPIGLQVQLAADIADTTSQFVVSTIWRVGKVRR